MTDRVEFRKWRDDGEIFALFPNLPADDDGNVTSYAHIGQHGQANYDHCIFKSIPASPDEFAPLQKELEKIGYVLTVVKPMTTVEALEWSLGLLETLNIHHTHKGIVKLALNEQGLKKWAEARAILATLKVMTS